MESILAIDRERELVGEGKNIYQTDGGLGDMKTKQLTLYIGTKTRLKNRL